ncbi:MAG: extracellular solute-binding protein, partial [Clostridia bacterium]|nr:extracellular solute-binding protein [Clostridia bacterium]
MNHRKVVSTFLAVLIIISVMLIGCGSNNNTESISSNNAANTAGTVSNGTSGNEQLPPATLKIIMPGDRPADMDTVIAEIEKRLSGTLNIKLNLVFIPFSDLKQKTQLTLASGEDIDLVFDAPWNGMEYNINAGYYEPLDDLLPQYAPDVIKVRGQAMIDANKFSGKIYGVPMGNNYKQGQHYNIRKDLREKLGIAPITTREQLIDFAYKVKENYPDIKPIVAGSTQGEQWNSWGVFPLMLDTAPDYIEMTDALSDSFVLYYKNNDGKVYNLFDTKEPRIWDMILEARKLYQDGIID